MDIEKLEKINIGDIKPERVLYAGNRWRDSNDFEQAVQYNPGKAFLAPDGATIIPCQYDLIRANNLSRSKPGRKLYSIDELYKRVWQCDITDTGLLTKPIPIIEEGDYKVRKINDKIYVGDDNIKIYENGKLSETIKLPQRPTTFDFGGDKRNDLIVTTRHELYLVKKY
jgi:sugar lactone lactonase YvrE